MLLLWRSCEPSNGIISVARHDGDFSKLYIWGLDLKGFPAYNMRRKVFFHKRRDRGIWDEAGKRKKIILI